MNALLLALLLQAARAPAVVRVEILHGGASRHEVIADAALRPHGGRVVRDRCVLTLEGPPGIVTDVERSLRELDVAREILRLTHRPIGESELRAAGLVLQAPGAAPDGDAPRPTAHRVSGESAIELMARQAGVHRLADGAGARIGTVEAAAGEGWRVDVSALKRHSFPDGRLRIALWMVRGDDARDAVIFADEGEVVAFSGVAAPDAAGDRALLLVRVEGTGESAAPECRD